MMKLNIWMGAKAVVEVFFGIGFVLVPVSLMSLFGVSLNPGVAVIARLCGAVFIASSITLWQSRMSCLTIKSFGPWWLLPS